MNNFYRIFQLLFLSGISLSLFSQHSLEGKDCICLNKLKKIKAYDAVDLDKKPEFPGGDAALIKYVAENLKCPVTNIDEIQSTIYAKFVINTSGKVSEACIIRPFYGNKLTEIEKEFLKVLLASPAWKPGEHKGKKVAVWFIIPMHLDYR